MIALRRLWQRLRRVDRQHPDAADLITDWEFECACGFSFVMPILADDPTGEYALSVAMAHLIDAHPDDDD